MSSRAPCTLVALALFALTGLADPVDAQVVEGRVVGPEDGAVAGATLLLVDDAFQPVDETVTDDEGRYRLEAPGDGEYTIVARLEGFANQTSEPLALVEGSPVTLDLTLAGQRVGEADLAATDTLEGSALVAQAVAEQCRGQFMPAAHGILFGTVVDSMTSQPIPGAEAIVRFADRSGMSEAGIRSTRTDENGIWIICDVPAGQDLRVRPEALGMSGRVTRTQLRSGTMKKMDLRLAVSEPDEPGSILGRVYDRDTGEPIPGAEVRIEDAGLGTLTNQRGVFRMPEVPPGLQVVSVDHLGHGHQEDVVRVLGGQAAEVEVRMSTEPIEMAPMLVRVRPRRWFSDMSDLESRIANGFGFIITEDELEDRQPRHLADALRNVPGVDVVQSGGTVSGEYQIQIRNARSMDMTPCSPMVWVDGQKIGRDSAALTSVWGPDLYAVEVYRSAAETPGEFSGQDASCGVIVAWTKRGR